MHSMNLIVFIGGFAASEQYAEPMCRELQQLSCTKVYNFALKHGLSLDQECNHILSLLNQHTERHIVLIGFSTGCNVAASTILRLARDFGNIAAVKEATENIGQISELLEERPPHFSVLTGEDSLILPFMAMGGDGVISVAANEIPAQVKQLVEAARAGNLEEARSINSRYRKLLKLNFIESNPVPVKYALARMGMIEENYRLPLVPLSEESKQRLDEELKALGIL